MPRSNTRCASGRPWRSWPRDRVAAPMSEVITSITIDAPPEKVWAVVMDPSRFGEWVTIHRKLINGPKGVPREGDEMEQTLHLRGVNFHVRWELAKCDAPL